MKAMTRYLLDYYSRVRSIDIVVLCTLVEGGEVTSVVIPVVNSVTTVASSRVVIELSVLVGFPILVMSGVFVGSRSF